MGNSGNSPYEYTEFRQAVKVGNYPAAKSIARRLPRLDLFEALDLTLLAAEYEPDCFDPMAVHWIDRLLKERQVGIADVFRVTEMLESATAGTRRQEVGASIEAVVREKPRR